MLTTKFALVDEDNRDYEKGGQYVGVFLKGPGPCADRPGPAHPNHVGLLFVDGEGATREFHFVTDNRILNKVLTRDKPYFHAAIGFDSMNAKAFAGYLNVFLEEGKLPRIKYGLDWFMALGSFDENGHYRYDDDERRGMTCSIFVSELLTGFGHPVVDYSKWPQNQPSDLAWRRKKIEGYRERGTLSPERVTEMERLDPFVRLRPEEVAAVAAEDFGTWDGLEHHREPHPEGCGGNAGDFPLTIEELAADVVQEFAAVLP